jgi:hypothetical protein
MRRPPGCDLPAGTMALQAARAGCVSDQADSPDLTKNTTLIFVAATVKTVDESSNVDS